MIKNRSISVFLGSLALSSFVACGDETPSADGIGGSGGGGPTEAPTFDEPLYAMMVQVYDTEDRTVYAHLTHSLELGDIELADAREFPSVANFVPHAGRLLVSSGQGPSITQFDVSDDFVWLEGETIGFAGFPVGDNANLFGHHFLDEHTAYMPYDLTKRVIWDPTSFEILDTREDSSIEIRRGDLMLDNAGNRNSVHFEGDVQQVFYYVTEDWFRLGPESIIAFYDRETHEESHTLTIPCPGLSVATRDEQGYTYYGTWMSPITLALFGEGPLPCNVRLTPEGELDEAWTTDFTEWTDGRYVNNFRYIGSGRAVGSVLHHELIDADWDAGYDPAIDDVVANGGYWRLWLFDLNGESAHEVEGIDVSMGDAVQFAVLEGRTFVFLPYDEWSRTRIYEIDDNGVATERGDTVGDVFKWVRVR